MSYYIGIGLGGIGRNILLIGNIGDAKQVKNSDHKMHGIDSRCRVYYWAD